MRLCLVTFAVVTVVPRGASSGLASGFSGPPHAVVATAVTTANPLNRRIVLFRTKIPNSIVTGSHR
ncbi:hypothetical protein GCM10022247_43100 [Allokutzneria multivorans]|uniref:Secreted protein n=1 Tax=Allokutzneria multivorans TaxID=1142134 RepID=A0ABP7SRL7_9PSEU